MTSKLKKLGTSGLILAIMAASNPAFAAGTASGTNVVNTATVDFQVGGVNQPQQSSNNATFVVDRKVNLTVAEVGNTTTNVAPGSSTQVTAFTLQNTSNSVLDFALTTTQQVGGAATHGGTDTFDVTAPTIYRDTNGNGTYDAGTDTVVTFIDELAADTSVTLFVVANIPIGLATGAIADIALTATGREGGGAGSLGAALVQTAGANTAGVDTVFADTAGTNDAARDGAHSDDDDFTVSAASLTATKTSTVISDPFNGTTNPKMIPGAVVEYCIAVANAAGGAPATGVTINDSLATASLDTTVAFVPGSIRLGSSCVYASGVAGGTYTAGTKIVSSGAIASLAAGGTTTMMFQVTVQ
jgi:hypothetical protein